jgi:hypothetical protein
MKTSLKLIKQQLQDILKRLNWKFEPNPNGQLIRLSGLNGIRPVLNDIESLQLFAGTIKGLKSSVIYTSSMDDMNAQVGEGNSVNNQLTLLKTLVQNFLEVLLKTVPEENIDSVNIKLPDLNDFDDLSKISRDLHLALTQVVINEDIKGETKITSVENGSIWINVFVGATAVTVIASLAWSSAVIYKKIQEGRMLEQQVRGLKVKNDSLEDILKAQKKETDLALQAEAEYVNSEHFKNGSPENIERIKNSIGILAELINKGAEIHPALVAPENVANLFPDPTKLIGVESKIKKLTGTSGG